jgi:hypothetical protein
MAQLGANAALGEVARVLAGHFGRVFECEMLTGETTPVGELT